MKNVLIGVPQGSILRPLLYILNVNDFQNAVDYIPRLYADDTCLVVHDNSSEKLQYSLNTEIEKKFSMDDNKSFDY